MTVILSRTYRNLLLIAISLIILGSYLPASAVTMITPDEFRVWQEQGRPHLLVDVRPPHRYEMGHIEGAMNVPYWVLPKKHYSSKVPLVIYCNDISGYQSMSAAQGMETAGHTQVYVLAGGLEAWHLKGLPRFIPQMGFQYNPLAYDVTPEDLQRYVERSKNVKISRPVTLIDLRPEAEFQKFHVKGSINIPHIKGRETIHKQGKTLLKAPPEPLQLPGNLKESGPNRVLVLIDDGNGAAMRQAEMLRRQGLSARFLSGGAKAFEILTTDQPKTLRKTRRYQ